MRPPHLNVRLHGKHVGRLHQAPDGALAFTYHPLAHQALSLGMPVREAAYDHAACEAFFGPLLPADPAMREAIARHTHAADAGTFALLAAVGGDGPGAVSLHASDDPAATWAGSPLAVDPLDEDELAERLRALPERPCQADGQGLRLTLAGEAPKLPVCLVNGQPALPRPGTPTTHLLKPALDGQPDTVLNEYLCLKLARAAGLDAPDAEIREARGIRYLLVTRFDRARRRDGHMARVHQETLVQALGARADGAPDHRACFELVTRCGAPARPVARLLRRVVFNVLIGNDHAHARHYAMVHPEGESPVMAPVYGVMCTRVVPSMPVEMAMAIGGERRAERLTPAHWQAFCQDANVSFAMLTRTMIQVSGALETAIEQERAAGAPMEALGILDAVEAHAKGVMARFQAAEALSPC